MTTQSPARSRALLYGGIAILVVFIAAMLWQLLQTRRAEARLAEARQELAVARLEATLGAATIEAQQGSYELARQLASRFFTGMQARVDEATPATRGAFEEILAQRDAVITMLSRNDPQSASMLSLLFRQLRTALYGPTRLDPIPAPLADSAAAAPAPAGVPETVAPAAPAPADSPAGG